MLPCIPKNSKDKSLDSSNIPRAWMVVVTGIFPFWANLNNLVEYLLQPCPAIIIGVFALLIKLSISMD